ncbi:MAG: glycoside hydrolase family 172 protein [Candidatus Helarchaeota archaeon]
MSWFSSSLRNLPQLRSDTTKRRRISSHSPTHSNKDFLQIRKNEKKIIADVRGAGCITHIWTTMDSSDRYYLRKIVLRAFWDNEEDPSIEVPIGDFFGMGHGICKNFNSLPLSMSPEDGRGFNCFFPMPFASRATFEIENQGRSKLIFYYHIDYEEYAALPNGLGRFHACWRRENPCQGISEEGLDNVQFQLGGKNEDFSKNYVILEAEGKGHYVGCNLNIHNLRETELHNWPGEGDDMIFIDGDHRPTMPPIMELRYLEAKIGREKFPTTAFISKIPSTFRNQLRSLSSMGMPTIGPMIIHQLPTGIKQSPIRNFNHSRPLSYGALENSRKENYRNL